MRTQFLMGKLLKNEFFINALHTVIKEIITYSFLSMSQMRASLRIGKKVVHNTVFEDELNKSFNL